MGSVREGVGGWVQVTRRCGPSMAGKGTVMDSPGLCLFSVSVSVSGWGWMGMEMGRWHSGHLAPSDPDLLSCKLPSAGRIMDFMETGKLATDSIKFFVLDEAGGWLCQQLVFPGFSLSNSFWIGFWGWACLAGAPACSAHSCACATQRASVGMPRHSLLKSKD